MKSIIKLSNIAKEYKIGTEEIHALRSVSLEIFKNEYVALMGPSGSGKSTLMNILGCLDKPTAGTYLFGGRDIRDFGPDDLAWLRREAFGFVFQSYNLLPHSTALENVEIPAIYAGLSGSERRIKAEALLTSLGLGDRMDHRPSQLSGGQQQRVSIARAMINGGNIILADEPTGALDSKSGVEVINLLKSLARQGHTVIIITHDPKLAENADRIIEFSDGEVVKDRHRERPDNMRSGATQEHGVAISFRSRHGAGAYHAACPAEILDHYCAEHRFHALDKRTCNDIVNTARRKRHNQADRFGRVTLRERWHGGENAARQNEKCKDGSACGSHSCLFSGVAHRVAPK